MKFDTLALAAAAASAASAAVLDSRQAGVDRPAPRFTVNPGTIANCDAWWDQDGVVDCKVVLSVWEISDETFRRWNPSITAGCGNFQENFSYCVAINGPEPEPTTTAPPTTTTTPPNGITTPTPNQPGMVSNCNKFHLIKTTTTCQGIADYNKIALADFLSWNPSVGSACNLVLGTYACAGVIASATTTQPPTTTTTNGIATPTPNQPGMVGNCNKFHLIKTTTTCQGIADYNKISLTDFYSWNPSVGSACNLVLGTYACAGVVASGTTTTTQPPTTTSTGNGVSTPTPIQAGMVTNCNKFHLVKETTTCQGVLDYNKITLANFVKWNPAVGSQCTNLWLGYYACVGVL